MDNKEQVPLTLERYMEALYGRTPRKLTPEEYEKIHKRLELYQQEKQAQKALRIGQKDMSGK